MKKFMLVLLAAFLVVGMVMAEPKVGVTLVSEGLFITDSSTDKVKVESWDSLYARVSGTGLSPYLSMSTGLGARDSAIIGYWGQAGLGIQGGKSMFWSAGIKANLVDIGFGLEGGLGGMINLGDTKLRLEGTGDIILPFIDKTAYTTKNDNQYMSFGVYPKVGFILKNGLEIGGTFNLSMENRLVNGKTNTDIKAGPYIRWGKGELGFVMGWNRWNLDSDGNPEMVPDIRLSFTL